MRLRVSVRHLPEEMMAPGWSYDHTSFFVVQLPGALHALLLEPEYSQTATLLPATLLCTEKHRSAPLKLQIFVSSCEHTVSFMLLTSDRHSPADPVGSDPGCPFVHVSFGVVHIPGA